MSVDQKAFTQALLNPETAILVGLIDPKGRPAGKRFDVYRNNVIVGLMDAMETAFPVIQKLIGAENFRNLLGAYVRQHPP
ncbi:MAG: DNA-binding domain-containing protein [Amylibacter sp.]